MKDTSTHRPLALHRKTKRQEGVKTWRWRERATSDRLTGSALLTASVFGVHCTFKV